jgi:hypothetical protein
VSPFSRLLGILFNPDDGDEIFYRNFCQLSTDYTALYPGTQNSSQPPLSENQIQQETKK